MTVAELIEKLKAMPQDLLVVDHWDCKVTGVRPGYEHDDIPPTLVVLEIDPRPIA